MGMVSALIEAKKFKAENGLMLVHSFSRINEGLDDYIQFLALFDLVAQPDIFVFVLSLYALFDFKIRQITMEFCIDIESFCLYN